MANLSGGRRSHQASRNSHFVDVRPDQIDDLVQGLKPWLSIPNPSDQDSRISLHFRTLDDFEPHKIAQRSELLRSLLSETETIISPSGVQGRQQSITDPHLPDEVSKYVDLVLHDAAFKSLHAAWLGIAKVLDCCKAAPSVKVAVLDITKEELASRDPSQGSPVASEALVRALEPLSTQLYGGQPPAALIADFEFSEDDSDALSALAQTAESFHTVFIGAASATFLPRNSYENINERALKFTTGI